MKDMLRACIFYFQGKLEEYMSLAEFFYNNSYQVTTKMTTFNGQYGKRCRTSLCWNDLNETLILGSWNTSSNDQEDRNYIKKM